MTDTTPPPDADDEADVTAADDADPAGVEPTGEAGEFHAVEAEVEPAAATAVRLSGRRHAIVWGSVAAALLLVGGGTTAVLAATSTNTTVPQNADDHDGASIAPRDELEVVGAPKPILAASCSDLISDQLAANLFDTPLSLHDDVDSAPIDVRSADLRQAGATLCRWGGFDGGYYQGVDVLVVPDGAEYYADRLREPNTIDRNYVEVDTHGDASDLFCSSWDHWSFSCRAHVVVDAYLVEVNVMDYHRQGASDEMAEAAADRVLAAIVAGIRSAGEPRKAWTPPADSYDGKSLCALSSAQLTSLTGIPGLQRPEVFENEDYPGAESLAASRLVTEGCWWSSPTEWIGIQTFRGAAWSVAVMTDPQDYYEYEQVWNVGIVAGADVARVSCNYGSCRAFLAVEGSRVFISLAIDEPSVFIPAVERLLATIDRA